MDPASDQGINDNQNVVPSTAPDKSVITSSNMPTSQPSLETPVFASSAQPVEIANKPSNKRKWFLFGGIGVLLAALIVAGFMFLPGLAITQADYKDMDANTTEFSTALNKYYASNATAIALQSVPYSLALDKQIDAAVTQNLKDVEVVKTSFEKLKSAKSTANIRADFSKRAIYDNYENKMSEIVAYSGRFSHSLKPYIYGMRILKTDNFSKEDVFSQLANVSNELSVVENGLTALDTAVKNGKTSNSGLSKEQGLKYYDNKYKTLIAAMQDLNDAGGEPSTVGKIYLEVLTKARVAYGQMFDDTVSVGLDQAKVNHSAAIQKITDEATAELNTYKENYNKYTASTFDITKVSDDLNKMLADNIK